jgi:hypothetical protein
MPVRHRTSRHAAVCRLNVDIAAVCASEASIGGNIRWFGGGRPGSTYLFSAVSGTCGAIRSGVVFAPDVDDGRDWRVARTAAVASAGDVYTRLAAIF